MIKPKWILVITLLSSSVNSAIECNHMSWHHNLTQFNQLESIYNIHVDSYNLLLKQHQQRKLISHHFSLSELNLFWQTPSNREILLGQIDAAVKFGDELIDRSDHLQSLSIQSQRLARQWQHLSDTCEASGSAENATNSGHYYLHSKQLGNDYRQLASRVRKLAELYHSEASALLEAKNAPH